MADSSKNRGGADRSRVSHQKHEVSHLAEKTKMPTPLVKKIIESEGPNRKAVERKLGQMKESAKQR